MHYWRLLLAVAATVPALASLRAEPLPETKPLSRKGDLAAAMVEGIDKYLMRELVASVEKRKEHWKLDFSSLEAYEKSVRPNRERMKKILGVVDQRVSPVEMEYVGSATQPALVAETETYKIHAVRWPVLPGMDGEGLLLEPKSKIVAQVVALPEADWTPEMAVGLAPGVERRTQFPRLLATNGCRVLVPVLIDRKDTWSGNPALGRMTNQTHREFIYRMAYEMGRHIIGYEVQKVLAAVDWFTRKKEHLPVGVFGYGEGGMLALYSSAVDERIQSTVVSGYFERREEIWREPIYRNVCGLLGEFGDADLIYLIIPRALTVEQASFKPAKPPAARAGRSGAAPGVLEVPGISGLQGDSKRTRTAYGSSPKSEPAIPTAWYSRIRRHRHTPGSRFRQDLPPVSPRVGEQGRSAGREPTSCGPSKEFRPYPAPKTPIRSTRRLHAKTDARLRPLSPTTFLGQTRLLFAGEISKILRAIPQTTLGRSSRQAARADAVDESTNADDLR